MITKFRAWYINEKCLAPVNDINFEKGIVNEHDVWRFFNEVILMMSTGLRDRKGAEIFEGDVVVNDRGERGYIKLTKHGFVFVKRIDTDEHAYYTHGIGAGAPFEIVGNIHENPELL